MTTPSTADSQDAAEPVRPVVEKGAVGPSATHAVVKGQVAPRQPHERDESSDSGKGEPTEIMRKAAHDVDSGRTDEPRGPQTQQHYSDLTEEAGRDAKRGERPVPSRPAPR